MKTAKKLFSLLLVAVLLMSAIPFQASASTVTPPTPPTEYAVHFWGPNGEDLGVKTCTDMQVTPPAHPTAPAGQVADGWIVDGSAEPIRTATLVLGNGNFVLNSLKTRYISNATANYKEDPTHTHSYSQSQGVVTPATCTEQGYTTTQCDNEDGKAGTSCSHTKKDQYTAALGHDFGEWAVVTPAQVGVAGLEKRECEREGCNHFETRAINALPVPTYTITFKYEDESVCTTENWPENYLITDLPDAMDIRNKRFDGWYTAKVGGERVQVGNTWYGTNQYTTLYARYIDSTKDNVSNVSVFVRFYSEGIQQGETIYLESFELTDNAKLLAALQARQADFATKIYNIKSSNDYLWNESFYMYASGEKITDSDMRIDGDTSILLKVDAKKSAKANVLLYVHNKAGEAATRLYEMNGYTAGNTVTSAAVQNFLKAQTGKTYTISGLYDQDRWEQLADGQNPTAAGGLDVPASGTLKIHVILSNFSSSTSSKPASNPSTGDPIMATAGIMVLAAAALVSILELRKRKMI